ncbi:MAG: alanine--tRNA ligase [Pseudomonadota bacterium]|nr:alanine--tRNA ligase [Pseudomonadota bacterium]
MSSVNEIRSTFLDYFRKRGHEVVASSPLVPRNDPTLMFTNAGMVQFKNVFTGLEKRSYKRAVTAQKCVRAGGKHNDLDNVGYTARHHTFFEMLGNFSFGDYFKDVAIEAAWDLVTREFGLAKDRLMTTVYAADDDAFVLWKKIAGLAEHRIVRIPTSDNFWAMGETGPCGPCSEIFYDHGEHIPGGPPGSADADGDRFIEIWNLVFMQFEQVTKEERVNLPRPSIDTGMGLERMAAVLQGTHDNYETDLFKALIRAIVEETGVPAEGPHRASNRVIADHLRAVSFLVADGVLPANEGRGYVLRRIMRRAMRHAELLGAREPLLWRLVPALVREMGAHYPELHRAQRLIEETLKLEETRFRKTLERGLKMLEEETSGLAAGDVLSGAAAFKLYDTYGFPLDLTQDALKPRGIGVDTAVFARAMERQRAEARAAWKGSGEAETEGIWFDIREKVGATEFLGYDAETAEGEVRAVVSGGKASGSLKAGESGAVVVNQTPFYGEAGGQVGDRGVLRSAEGALFRVLDTQRKLGDLIVHQGQLEKGSLKPGDAVELAVDPERRSGNRIHHSATHLVHEALRQVLGRHVAQKGSLVEPGRLRFDFSHPKSMSAEEIGRVEAIANAVILGNDDVVTRLMSVDAAVAEGAMALFGEKYGEEVRVVAMGTQPDGGPAKPVYSLELCGGTHVRRTGDVGLVKIIAESASAAGVRRLEALAGEAARSYLDEQDRRVAAAAALLKTSPGEVVQRIAALLDERRRLERELAEARRQLAMGATANPATSDISEVAGIRFMGRVVAGVDPKDLKSLADEGKKTVGSGVVALVAVSGDGKGAVVVAVTDDLTQRFNAVDLVRAGSQALGGKGGGGRPDMAQAGGPTGANAAAAVAAVKDALAGG